MQHEQHRTGDIQRSLGSWLSVLLLLAAVPLLAGVVGRGAHPSPPATLAMDPELGVPVGEPLLSAATGQRPDLDGVEDAAWEAAEPLTVPLHYGLHGRDPAGTLYLRSLHDEAWIYFLVQWNSPTPGDDPDAWRNLFTVHWRLVPPESDAAETAGSGLACTVACHTATVDGHGGLVTMRSETIPPGLDEDLPAGGGWAEGRWTLEWGRPLVSESPYDQHLTDPTRAYRFFVKILEGRLGQPDPVSDVHDLRLRQ